MGKTKGAGQKAGERTHIAGRLSNKDLAFIRANYNKLSPEQIQNRIPGRALVQIQREVDKCNDMASSLPSEKPKVSPKKVNQSVAERLQLRPEWSKWQNQFTDEELNQFITKYVELMGQLQEVTTTEDMTVISLITSEILMDRVLVSKRQIIEDKNFAQNLLNLERAKPLAKRDLDAMDKLQVDIETSKACDRELTAELKIFEEQKTKSMQSLKATRDQRFKVNENSNRNFLGMLALLGQDTEQQRASERMIMSYLSSELEKVRLAKPHKFADGIIDRPFLNDETVDMEDEDEDEEA